jgi:hypothetical protein
MEFFQESKVGQYKTNNDGQHFGYFHRYYCDYGPVVDTGNR